MAVDATQGIFAANEYRYIEQQDAAVKTQSPSAKDAIVETNLSASGRDALALELFNDMKNVTKSFNVVVDGTSCAALSTFDGSPPTFQSIFTGFTDAIGRKQRPISILIDNNNNTTTMTLRG